MYKKNYTFFIFLSLVFLWCVLAQVPLAALASSKPSEEVDAPKVYERWCSSCHGLKGRGDGVNSTLDMAINPRDHTDPLFMTTRSDDQLADVISGGGTKVAKSPIMPPWEATLTKEEIRALVVYMRGLCDCVYEGVISHKKLRRVDINFR